MAIIRNNTENANSEKFRKHLPKILSVVAAVILWFYVLDVQSTPKKKENNSDEISVQLENFVDSDIQGILSGNDKTFQVTVSFTNNNSFNIAKDDVVD